MSADYLTLTEACRILRCHRTTFIRYVDQGLDAWRFGRRWYTTVEAIERFKARPNEPARGSDAREALRKEFSL